MEQEDLPSPERLIEAYLDCTLTPEGEVILRKWLEEDVAHVDEFLQQIDVHASLYEKWTPVFDEELSSPPTSKIARPKPPAKAQLVRHNPRPTRRTLIGWSLASVAAILVITLSIHLFKGHIPEDLCAEVVDLAGSVDLRTGSERSPTHVGARIEPGQSVIANFDGHARLRYLDGTLLNISASTELTLEIHDKAKHLRIERGELSADVQKQSKGAPMLVSTPQAQAEVVGTQFTLRTASERTQLDVTEGKVKLTRSADGKSIEVGAAQSAVAAKGLDFTVKGRFVRIQIEGGKHALTLAEVEIFSNGTNIARHGKASQLSVFNNGVPERAIDGRTDGAFNNNSVTHTVWALEPWWEVDLGDTFSIDRVVIWNRTDTPEYNAQLNNYSIKILDAQRIPMWQRHGLPQPKPYSEFKISPEFPQK